MMAPFPVLAIRAGYAEDTTSTPTPHGRRAKLLFESELNRKITWDHLLRQTSDWEGTLWGKPEWADRSDQDRSSWGTRPRNEPGTVYEYNDTRVNLLALAATAVWRRPLPEVPREHVMDPIGASTTWGWYGYDNSWITLDGRLRLHELRPERRPAALRERARVHMDAHRRRVEPDLPGPGQRARDRLPVDPGRCVHRGGARGAGRDGEEAGGAG